ncbi:hypothetical protein K503DRAFT_807074 [Rhizopogon vinicolor AM-OR11-026]|uniref:Uncharacterized protein n=1 Tax=Rhizopogon vinicolor AM-OR11-026 TaxID=1314800 RepID=A0A1B7MD83_9AGAM|nr:hypothetical protein K503DRAFT_807074 [Rhizopogon vinicolor AM-OR11-026]
MGMQSTGVDYWKVATQFLPFQVQTWMTPAGDPVAGEQAVLLTPPVAVPEDMSTGTMDQKNTSEEEMMA